MWNVLIDFKVNQVVFFVFEFVLLVFFVFFRVFLLVLLPFFVFCFIGGIRGLWVPSLVVCPNILSSGVVLTSEPESLALCGRVIHLFLVVLLVSSYMVLDLNHLTRVFPGNGDVKIHITNTFIHYVCFAHQKARKCIAKSKCGQITDYLFRTPLYIHADVFLQTC